MSVKKELKKYSSPAKAKILQRFFKTGKGDYGEGDIFIGVTVPNIRIVANQFKDLSLTEVKKVLHSKIHEERLCALLILVEQFSKAEGLARKKIVDFYLKNTQYINNWDLVDLSAPKIVGVYFLDKPSHTSRAGKNKKILYKLAKSKNLWEKRIAILATYAFIKENDFKDTLEISEILLNDQHDLMHKAVGWMLREVGKRDMQVEEKFLKLYYKKMPRTMLRYAIERFPEKLRQAYLKGKI